MITAEHIANALNLRSSGKSYRGPCPCCGGSDQASKFVVRDGRSRAVWTCHAGCSGQAITTELRYRGILPKPKERPTTGRTYFNRAQIEYAQLVCLIAEADIRNGKPISKGDCETLIKSARVVAQRPRNTAAGRLAAAALNTPGLRELL
jgi:hypothetical protein